MTINEIKLLKKLQQKKSRLEEKKYFVEGEKLMKEAILNSENQIEVIYYCSEPVPNIGNVRSEKISDKDMSRITVLKNHSGYLTVLRMQENTIKLEGNSIFLDDIKDPGNMGTIIRSADWFGIKTIYHTKESVDIFNPKVIQATMGSFFRVSFIETTIGKLYKENQNLIGATLDGVDVTTFITPKNYCLVIGNESKGIHPDSLKYLSKKVKIPAYGNAESLNASVATGILLYQFSQS